MKYDNKHRTAHGYSGVFFNMVLQSHKGGLRVSAKSVLSRAGNALQT